MYTPAGEYVMYLRAQRVIVPDSHETGINAFLYSHPGRHWDTPPDEIPDQSLGLLAHKRVDVEHAGNRVCSYLDIVAPDHLDRVELKTLLLAFLKSAQGQPLPYQSVSDPCRFRLGMDAEIAEAGWKHEIAALATAASELLAR